MSRDIDGTSLHTHTGETTMAATKKLYRVLVRTTSILQLGSDTHWASEVLYCGWDRDEALRVYHESRPGDYWRGHGGRCRETKGQSKEYTE
jgi:hypothetical protein